MLRRPIQPRDESGQCRHLYLTGDATCAHCGMKFRLEWHSERAGLLRPTVRNLAFGAAAGALLLAAQVMLGQGVFTALFLVAMVLFFTRTVLGGLEVFARHGFIPGTLGPLLKRARFNPLAPKPYVTHIGRVKFPIDKEAHERFKEGDTLLVEHLRWSRLPVAIYLGTLPTSAR